MSWMKVLVGLAGNLAVLCAGTYLRSSKESPRQRSFGALLQILSALALVFYIVAAVIAHFLLHNSASLF